jgi:hypothetical protein
VLILNVVKVLCFDTLLQVLILKIVKVDVAVFLQSFARGDKSGLPPRQGWGRHRAGGHPHPGCPVVAFGIPHPRYFGKRGCKLLKTKDRSYKKSAKRLQEIDRSRVRAGATGVAGELPARELRDLGGDEGDHGEG